MKAAASNSPVKVVEPSGNYALVVAWTDGVPRLVRIDRKDWENRASACLTVPD